MAGKGEKEAFWTYVVQKIGPQYATMQQHAGCQGQVVDIRYSRWWSQEFGHAARDCEEAVAFHVDSLQRFLKAAYPSAATGVLTAIKKHGGCRSIKTIFENDKHESGSTVKTGSGRKHPLEDNRKRRLDDQKKFMRFREDHVYEEMDPDDVMERFRKPLETLQEERQKRLEAENRARDFETQLQVCRTREAAVQRTLQDLTRNIERLQSQEEQHLREISLLKAKVRSKKNKQRNRRVRSHRKMRSNLSSSQLKPCGKRKRRETYKRRLFETFDSFHREVKKAKVELTLAGQDKPQHLTWPEENSPSHQRGERTPEEIKSVQRWLRIKDKFVISDAGYQEIRMMSPNTVPPLYRLVNERVEQNKMIQINTDTEVCNMSRRSVREVLTHLLRLPKHKSCGEEISVRFSGDGRQVTRNIRIVTWALCRKRNALPGIAKLQVIHLDFIDACMRENDEYTSPDLQKLLIDRFGLSVACSTIRCHRYLIGWIKSGPRYCQVIRPQTREKRQEWSQRMLASGENFDNPHIEHTCNAATLPELEHAITKSFNPSHVSFHIQHVLDFKTWLSSELEDISGHSIPHCFKFTMGPHQQPNIHYKEYSTEWKNTTGTAFQLLRQTPTRSLSHVILSPIKHLEAIHDGIQIARSMSRLTGDQNDCWEDFISSLHEEYQPPEVYIMPEDHEENVDSEARNNALDKLIQRENKKAQAYNPCGWRNCQSRQKDDFEYGHGWSLPRTRVERKTPQEESDSWPILEVIRRVDEHHVEVKWAPTTRVWPNSIVDLRYNPQLADALGRNCCNPAIKVFKDQQLQLSPHSKELRLLRQHIFDKISVPKDKSDTSVMPFQAPEPVNGLPSPALRLLSGL
ncbi:hypothetical protein Bbelb_290810 [Branchiostoma belcheri]|nr:hypothetical protein Bbelb_290810 [Branchiostoma belcheri]